MARKWKMVTIVERFKSENGVPRERLSCGHIRIDPIAYYENETCFKIKRAAEALSPAPIKARCYKCGRGAM